MSLFKELIHQGLVILGSSLDKSLMKFTGMLHLIGRDLLYSGDTAVRTPGVFFHKQNVDHSIEAGSALNRILHSHDLIAEMLTHLFDHVFIIRFLTIKLIESEYHRFLEFLSCAEYILCAHLHTILSINENDTGVCDVKSCDGVTHEVIGSRAVNHIEFLAEKFSIEHSREYRIAIFLLNRERIGYGVARFNGATTFYHSTLVKHSFSERGFTRALASEKGNVFNLVGLIDFHILLRCRCGK